MLGFRNRTIAGLALAGLFAVAACQPPAAQPDYAAQYDPALDAIFAAWTDKAYDGLDGKLATNYSRLAPDANAASLDELKAFMAATHTVYPDLVITSGQRAYAPGIAFVQWTATGTDRSPGGTGQPISVTGSTMYRFADGMITHEYVYFDTAELMRQTGTQTVPHAAK